MSSKTIEERISFLEGKVEGSLEQINKRLESLDKRIEALDKKIDSQFRWIVGEMIAIMISWLIPILLKIYFP